MELVEEEEFTFSYGQCLYCFIGLVQIKTSVLREEETGHWFSTEDKQTLLSLRFGQWQYGGRTVDLLYAAVFSKQKVKLRQSIW